MVELPSLRHHYLFASVTKHVFMHQQRGVVFAHDAIHSSDAEYMGLRPLYLLGISLAEIPLAFLQFTSCDDVLDIGGFLDKAWSSASGLRGRPDEVTISRQLDDNTPNLKARLTSLGIQVNIADKSAKKLAAKLRSAQRAASSINLLDPVHNLDELNLSAQKRHEFNIRRLKMDYANRQAAAEWMQVPIQQHSASVGPIVCSNSAWMTKNGGHPIDKRSRELISAPKGNYLRSIDLVDQAHTETDDPDTYVPTYEDNRPELLKELLPNWPNPIAELSELCELSAAKIKSLAEKKSYLPRLEVEKLFEFLGFERLYDRTYSYTLSPNGVLIGRSFRALSYLHLDFSNGGDGVFFEAVPESEPRDPRWCYFISSVCDAGGFYVILADRGSSTFDKICKTFCGDEVAKEVPDQFYRDLVKATEIACAHTLLNDHAIGQFAAHYNDVIYSWSTNNRHYNREPATPEQIRAMMPEPWEFVLPKS